MGCISCDRSRSRYMYYDDDNHDPYFRIGKGKEPRKKQRDTDISRLPYSTYLTIVTSPVLCLVCIVHTYQESQNKVDKGVEIVYSRISSGNYFTCMYQSAVNICDGREVKIHSYRRVLNPSHPSIMFLIFSERENLIEVSALQQKYYRKKRERKPKKRYFVLSIIIIIILIVAARAASRVHVYNKCRCLPPSLVEKWKKGSE